jgi:hypothetical protein
MFMSLSLVTLLVCVLPVLVWLNQEPTCGPHNADASELPDGTCADGTRPDGTCEGTGAKVFETMGVYLEWLEMQKVEGGEPHILSGEFSEIVAFFFNPPVLIIMLCVMHTRHRYMVASYTTLQDQFELTTAAAAHKEKVMAEEMRLEKRQQAETRATDMGSSGVDKDSTPEEIREKQLLSLRKCFKQLDIDLKEQQYGHNREMNLGVKRLMDEETRKMDATGLLQRANDISPSAVQEHMALASGISHGHHDDESLSETEQHAHLMFELIAASTVLIRNIDPEFARPRVVEKVVKERTQGNILACTVRRVPSNYPWPPTASQHDADSSVPDAGVIDAWSAKAFGIGQGDKKDASLFPTYPHASWALVTFMTRASALKMCNDHDILKVNMDPDAQPFLGSWHAVSWHTAQTMLQQTLKVAKIAHTHARAQVIQARRRDELDGEETEEDKLEKLELARVAKAASARYEAAKSIHAQLQGMLGDRGDTGDYGNSAFLRKHNVILKTTMDDATNAATGDDAPKTKTKTKSKSKTTAPAAAAGAGAKKVKVKRIPPHQAVYPNPLADIAEGGSGSFEAEVTQSQDNVASAFETEAK